MSAALAVVGVLAALADRRVELPAPTARRLSGLAVGAGLAVLTAAVVVAGAADPLGAVSDRWDEFKAGGSEPTLTGYRLASQFASYRADTWTVAWENFKPQPMIGVGADNFARDYALRGKSNQTPKYPHSLEFRVLSETGLIGVLLLGGGSRPRSRPRRPL